MPFKLWFIGLFIVKELTFHKEALTIFGLCFKVKLLFG